MPLQLARAVNEVWSMDIVSDSLASGRCIKFLNVADDCAVPSRVVRSFPVTLLPQCLSVR